MNKLNILSLIVICFTLSFFAPAQENSVDKKLDKIHEHYNANQPQVVVDGISEIFKERKALSNKQLLKALSLRGQSYLSLGMYEKALEDFISGLERSKEIKNRKKISDFLVLLGKSYHEMSEFEKAKEYFTESVELSIQHNDTVQLTFAYCNLGVIDLETGKPDKAIINLQMAQDLVRDREDLLSIAINIQGNLGSAYLSLGDLNMAEKNVQLQYKMSVKHGDKIQETIARFRLGVILCEREQYKEALEIFYECLEASETNGIRRLSETIMFNIIEVNERLRNYKANSEIWKRYTDNIQEGFEEKLNDKTIALKTKLDILKKDRKIEKLRQEQAYQDQIRTYLIIGFSIFALLVLIIFSRQRKLLKKEKLLSSYQIQEKQRLKAELSKKKKDLLDLALHLRQLSEFFDRIKTEMSVIGKKAQSNEVESKVKSLQLSINQYRSQNMQKKEFFNKFNELNTSFFIGLARLDVALSKKEKELCALLRLGLSSKEIAMMYNIAPKSVDMSRYRLRKKLGLEKDKNFSEFFSIVDSEVLN